MSRKYGIDWLVFLKMVATELNPQSYLEIGTETGLSVSQFNCDSVCVDKEFYIREDVCEGKTRLSLFKMTSDRFFAEVNFRTLFPKGVDVALLDGMHRFEYLLRDFMNTEKRCHERSIILMHDCLPATPAMAERCSETRKAWAGDVWKLLPILKKYRPDIRVTVFDCAPTGLVACTGLDPISDVLKSLYYTILDEFGSEKIDELVIEGLWGLYPVVDTKSLRPHDLTMLL